MIILSDIKATPSSVGPSHFLGGEAPSKAQRTRWPTPTPPGGVCTQVVSTESTALPAAAPPFSVFLQSAINSFMLQTGEGIYPGAENPFVSRLVSPTAERWA